MRLSDLRRLVDEFGIAGVDRRSRESMSAALRSTPHATPELLLDTLSDAQVKEACDYMGINRLGTKNAVIRRLVEYSPSSNRERSRDAYEQSALIHTGPARIPPALPGRFLLARNASAGTIPVTRPELIWPGKYNHDGTPAKAPRVNLPLRTIETINERTATSRARNDDSQISMFDTGERNDGEPCDGSWRNKLVCGDNVLVMPALLEKYSGRIQLVYCDASLSALSGPLAATVDSDGNDRTGDHVGPLHEEIAPEASGRPSNSDLQTASYQLMFIRSLLSSEGHLVVHATPDASSYLRLLLDDSFGSTNFRNEIVVSGTGENQSARPPRDMAALPRGHDVLLWYSAQPTTRVPNAPVPRSAPSSEGHWRRFWIEGEEPATSYTLLGEEPPEGQWRWKEDRALEAVDNYLRFVGERSGRTLEDYWRETDRKLEFIRKSSIGEIEYWSPPESDETGSTVWCDIGVHEDPKNDAARNREVLLTRLIEWLSRPGDVVADFSCGSGTTLAVAERHGRRWLGCDFDRSAIHLARNRLLDMKNCEPFDVLDLGGQERVYWQRTTFDKGRSGSPSEQGLQRYQEYILSLHGARPTSDMVHLHGIKGDALVHVGAVDTAVSIEAIDAAVDECIKLKQRELQVLGWGWEAGVQDVVGANAKHLNVSVMLLQIPREVMRQRSAAGADVRFFPLPYLEAAVRKSKGLAVEVTLKGFVIPDPGFMPDGARDKAGQWSDYIDYWAVDWDFRNGTFVQGWASYRTRKQRALRLRSRRHTYRAPGKYRILVKVVDVFGNDASRALDVEVG